MAKTLENDNITKRWQEYGETGSQIHYWWEYKMVVTLENSLSISKKKKN